MTEVFELAIIISTIIIMYDLSVAGLIYLSHLLISNLPVNAYVDMIMIVNKEIVEFT